MHVRLRIYCTMKYLTSLCQNYKVWKLWKLHFTMLPRMKWVYSHLIFFWFLSRFFLTFFNCLLRWLFIPSGFQSRALWGMSLMIWKQRLFCPSIACLNCILTDQWNHILNLYFKKVDTWSMFTVFVECSSLLLKWWLFWYKSCSFIIFLTGGIVVPWSRA